MKKSMWTGLLLAAVMFMCGASYSSTYMGEGFYTQSPTYSTSDTMFRMPTELSAVAVSDISVLAMAGGGADDNNSDRTVPCMASCQSNNRIPIGISYQLTPDKRTLKTVMAVGYHSIVKGKPYRIPISI